MWMGIVLLVIVGIGLLYAGAAGVLIGFAPKAKKVNLQDLKAEPIRQDLSGLPELLKYKARNGTELEYRHYPAEDFPDKPVLILIHGISVDGDYFHTMASWTAGRGLAHVYVPNLRGYGKHPLRRGDVDYIGQVDDDLADLIRFIRLDHPSTPIVLGGHSGGGGTAIRMASGEYGRLISACLLLAPALPPEAPTNRKEASTGLISISLPRMIGLMMLNALGIQALNGLSVLRMNKPEEVLDGTETLSLSYRLLLSRMPPFQYIPSLQALHRRTLVLVGERDEEFIAEEFGPLFARHTDAEVDIVPGLTHDSLLIGEDTFHRMEAWWHKQRLDMAEALPIQK